MNRQETGHIRWYNHIVYFPISTLWLITIYLPWALPEWWQIQTGRQRRVPGNCPSCWSRERRPPLEKCFLRLLNRSFTFPVSFFQAWYKRVCHTMVVCRCTQGQMFSPDTCFHSGSLASVSTLAADHSMQNFWLSSPKSIQIWTRRTSQLRRFGFAFNHWTEATLYF